MSERLLYRLEVEQSSDSSTHETNYFNHALTLQLTHQLDKSTVRSRKRTNFETL